MVRLAVVRVGSVVLFGIAIGLFIYLSQTTPCNAEGKQVSTTGPTIKLLSPKSGVAWTRHPKCGATGRVVQLTIQVSDLEPNAIIYPVVRGGRKMYPKEPFQPAGPYYISEDGYGNPGNPEEHQEIVFFVLAKRPAKQAMDAGLHGAGIDSLPEGVMNLDKASTVLIKIMSSRDCKRPLPH